MKHSPKQKTISIVVLIVMALVILITTLEYKKVINIFGRNDVAVQKTSQDGINLSPPTEAEKQQMSEDKTDSTKYIEPTTVSPDQPSIVKITRAFQQDQNIIIQTELVGQSWQSCNLSLTRGTDSVIKSSETIYQSSNSICQGFAVPLAEFPSSGNWTINLSATKIGGQVYQSEPTSLNITK